MWELPAMQGKGVALIAQTRYTPGGMSEDAEDLNEFNSWDILGAMLMITMVPAIMNFVFNGQDVLGSAVIGGVGVLLSLAVFGLSLLTHWSIISRIVNLLGTVLTILYIALAVYLWVWGGESEPASDAAPEKTVQQ